MCLECANVSYPDRLGVLSADDMWFLHWITCDVLKAWLLCNVERTCKYFTKGGIMGETSTYRCPKCEIEFILDKKPLVCPKCHSGSIGLLRRDVNIEAPTAALEVTPKDPS